MKIASWVLLILYFTLLPTAQAELIKGAEIGPSLKVLSFPHPLSLGVETRFLDGLVGLSLHKGLSPRFTFEDTRVKVDSFDVGLKVHPFKGAFYIGALLGNQDVSGYRTGTVNGQFVRYDVSVESKFFTPHLGWRWQFKSGFFLGMEFGWQFSYDSQTRFATNQDSNPLVTGNQEYQRVRQDVINDGNDLGDKNIPHVSVLNLGWMF